MSGRSGDSEQVLAAALRAQADVATGARLAGARHPAPSRPRPAWAVLLAAAVLGALAGVLAGLISLL